MIFALVIIQIFNGSFNDDKRFSNYITNEKDNR